MDSIGLLNQTYLSVKSSLGSSYASGTVGDPGYIERLQHVFEAFAFLPN